METARPFSSALTLQQKLDCLFSLRKSDRVDTAIRPEYYELLSRLGAPQKNLPPVIHVAGTNGKGSVIAFMRAILEAAGYRVHVYTSPHLFRFNERIVLAGEIIGDQNLEALLDEIHETNGDLPQTFFELTTAMAFTAFARTEADIVLLETGVGGRLDPTNVVDHPLATVITPLSYDHTACLGGTIQSIAREKAGILKSGTPLILAPQLYPQVESVIEARAAEIGAIIQDWSRLDAPDSGHEPFGVQTRVRTLKNLPIPVLPGAHQLDNAATACATLLIQAAFSIPETAFTAGLQSAVWPARLQVMESSHDTKLTPEGWEVWLDGGHNDSAASVLASHASHWSEADSKPLHIITCMGGLKDAAAFAKPLAPFAASVTCIAFPGNAESGYDPESLARIWRDAGTVSAAASDKPLKDILVSLSASGKTGRILVTGSLYLAQLF